MEIEFKNTNNVEFFFSFLCPYSYLTWEVLKKELKDSTQHIKPVVLPMVNDERRIDSYYGKWSDERWAEIADMGKELGLTITKPQVTIDCSVASSLICLENDFLCEQIISAVFKGVFEDGMNISNDNELLDSLRKYDFTEKLINNLSYQKDKAPLEKIKARKLEIIKSHKIRMFPTLRIDNEYFIGLITTDIFKKSILQRL